jgi:hypothetical protein
MPINNEGDNLCRSTDVLNIKDGISKYYRHVIKFNNINGSMRSGHRWTLESKTGRVSISHVPPGKESVYQ